MLKFSKTGQFLLQIGKPGQTTGDDALDKPAAVAVDTTANEVYVADTGRNRIAVGTSDGRACAWPQGSPVDLTTLLLGGHWWSFFVAVKVSGVAVATLGFASFPAFTVLLEGLLFRERVRAAEWGVVALVSPRPLTSSWS